MHIFTTIESDHFKIIGDHFEVIIDHFKIISDYFKIIRMSKPIWGHQLARPPMHN